MEVVPVNLSNGSSNSLVVTQSNKLIEARYNLTAGEQRIMFLLISMISPDDIEFKDYEIKVSDYARFMGMKGHSVYERLNDSLDRLLSRFIHFKKEKGYLKVGWLSSAEYFEGKGIIQLSFDKKLKPYLLFLQKEFTKLNLPIVLSFKSFYSIKIYMLLKQYEKIGFREFDFMEFRRDLGIEDSEYPRFADFRKRVINQAKKEFETKNKEAGGYMSDITFDLETIRTGRKITRLRFNIRKQSYQERLPIDLPETEIKEVSANPAREALEKYGVKGDTANKYLDQQEEAEILRCVALLEQAIGAGKVNSSESGYLLKLLEARAGQETEADRQKKAKNQKKEEQFRKSTEEEQRRETENRLSSEFFRKEREKWLDSLTEEEKAQKFKEAKKDLKMLPSSVKDITSPLFMGFIQSQIPDYEAKRTDYLKENM